MSDELTPEEEKAFKSLPRERMPAGLEERVVGAMREHGFLTRRRRTIEFTNTRIAGVLAASVALMLGAYSIGLHRGGGEAALLPPSTTAERANRSLAETPSEAPESQPPTPTGTLGKTDQPAAADEAARKDTQATEKPVEAEEGLASREEKSTAAVPAPEAPPAQDALKRSAAMALSPRGGTAEGVEKRPLTFWLNGRPVVVEAPDSVRVVQDEQGRMLIIYTSDGIIRIRLAD